jgi:hypothetical protein
MSEYEAVVAFRNEGHEYGRETYRVQAGDRPGGVKAALTRSEDSVYDDPRIPTPSRRVVSCRLVKRGKAA